MSERETTLINKPNIGPDTVLNGMFAIDAKLASGGMGEVYRGHNITTGDPVAIKVVLGEFANDETVMGLFFKEAKVLNSLHHPGIVRYSVFSVDPVIGRPYLVMEYVDGLPLSEVIDGKPMPVAETKRLLARLASALDAAHKAGVIHRDISPDNVLLPDGEVSKAKIIDFGIARASNLGSGTLLEGKFAGKYNFVSPEQLGLFGGEVTDVSDVYSLALVAVNVLRGEPMNMNGTPVEVIEKRRNVPNLSGIDAGLRPILELMLQPDPAERKVSMAEIAEWLTPEAERPRSTPRAAPRTQAPRTLITPMPGGDGEPPPDVALPVVPMERGAPAQPFAPEAAASSAPPQPPSEPTVLAPSQPARVPDEHDPIAHIRIETGTGPVSPAAAASAVETPRARRSPLPLLVLIGLVVAGGGAGALYSLGFFGPSQPQVASLPAAPEPPAPASPAAPVPQQVPAAVQPSLPQVAQQPAPEPPEPLPEPEAQTQAQPQTLNAESVAPASAAPAVAAPEQAPEAVSQTVNSGNAAPAVPQPVSVPQAPAQIEAEAPAAAPAVSAQPSAQAVAPAPAQTPQTVEPALQSPATPVTPAPQPSTPQELAVAVPPKTPETLQPQPEEVIGKATDLAGAHISWLSGFNAGDCFFAHALASLPESMEIEGIASDAAPFETLDAAFTGAFGFSPAIQGRLISKAQCGTAEFLTALSRQRQPAVTISLENDRLRNGAALKGSLQNLKREFVVLYLIDNDGFAYRLDPLLKRKGDAGDFEVERIELTGDDPMPQLVLVLSSDRPIPGSLLSEPAQNTLLFRKLAETISVGQMAVDYGFAFFTLGGT